MSFYDRDGREIEQHEWAALFADKSYQRVSFTKLDDDVDVSTVWLGIDHSAGLRADPPIIFETMIFGGDRDQQTWRYSTEAEALLNHETIVAELRARRGQAR